MIKNKPKVLLVGWDAADWRIINPLLKQGKMPGLARLMAKSAWGNLVTIDPVISPMLWTSIATGKRPYKHGIHGFTEVAEDGQKVRPVRVTQRQCKALWNILNEKGFKTNVIGWWPSHPAEEVNGVSVSNFFAIPPKKDAQEWPVPPASVYPKQLAKELGKLRLHPAELTPAIMANFFPDANYLLSDDDPVLRSAMRILAHASSIQAVATEVMATTQWDFTAVYFDALDHFSHLGMKYHPPQMKGVSDEQFKTYHYVVEAAYRFHDMMLDRLLDLAGADCQVMLVSDHGFESGSKRLLNLPDEPGAPALEHRPYGVFVAAGDAFKPGPVYGASLLDVTPTLLNVFGLKAASDMDGSPLNSALKVPITSREETYETEQPKRSAQADNAGGLDEDMLDQLVELGYINRLNNEAEKQVALGENEYYLARSLADGGLLGKALAKIETLSKAYPTVQRYVNFKFSLLLRLGRVEDLDADLKDKENTPFIHYLKGLSLLQQQRPLLAAQQFAHISHYPEATIQVKIAMAWLQAGEIEQAKVHAQKALEIDVDEVDALNVLAESHMANQAYEEALAQLFKSLQLVYYQPKIHEQIGQCLQHLNHLEEAAQAYEVALRLMPNRASVVEKLKGIYANDARKSERLKALSTFVKEPGFVVTGFPRSGTSLMMQILKAAQVPILSDGKRQQDQFNAQGYFELQGVKDTLVDQSFMNKISGHGLKIVFPLLRFIKPIIPLKVIWMERPFEQIIQSQSNMKGEESKTLNFKLLANMQQEQALNEVWLNQHNHIEFIKVDYDALLLNPESELSRIIKFTNTTSKLHDLLPVVKPELKHF